MKKIWLIITWLCSLFLAFNFTDAKDYEYTNLDITANILEDWTINVKENFTANFFVEKHGIIRNIPLNYSVENDDFHINISDINVEWHNFVINEKKWEIWIKIWDANRTVIWKQIYPISYSVYGLIRNFSGKWYAELYRNLVWYKFDTNINKVKVELTLPKIYTWFTADDFLITTDWKTKTVDEFEWTVDWSNWNKIIITYDKWLPAYQWITLAIKFPNDYFSFDHNRQASLLWHTWNYKETLKLVINDALKDASNWDFHFLFFLLGLLAVILIILSPAILLIVIIMKFFINLFRNILWSTEESKVEHSGIIQYSPPKWLNSAEVWILYHRYNDPKDTFSLIYKWASEWFIKIQSWDENSEYSLIKVKNISWNHPEYEKNLFNELFSEDELVLNHSTILYKKLVNSWLQDYWIERWRFSDTKRKNSMWCVYLLLMFIWTPILLAISDFLGIAFFIFLWCIAFFWWTKWWLMTKTLKETEEWEKLISHILWYKQFLEVCDEKKLRTFLQQDPLYFDKTLPYAIVFWLDTELIQKISPIMEEMDISPTRYDGDIYDFSKSIETINHSAYNSHFSSWSSYSSDGWFDSWSSFDSGWSSFDSWWGWGGGWGSSW